MEENRTTKERLLSFISERNISVNKFEKMTNIPVGTIKNSRGDFKTETIRKIWEIFPELDVVWLILGDGYELVRHDIRIDSPSVEGSGNTIQAGDHNSYNAGETINKLVDELTAQRIAKDTQIDRLLSLLEKR